LFEDYSVWIGVAIMAMICIAVIWVAFRTP
jgi:cbb3-type cytochrome oxidase subunit 3